MVGMVLAFITGSTIMTIQLITLGKTNIIMAALLIGATTTIIDGVTTIIGAAAMGADIIAAEAAAVDIIAAVAVIAADTINS